MLVVNFIVAFGISFLIIVAFEQIKFLGNGKFLKYCGQRALEIYVIHCYFTAGFRTVFSKIGITSAALSLILNVVLSLALSIAFVWICKKIKIHQFIFKPYKCFMKKKRTNEIILICVIVVMTIINVLFALNDSVWGDEAFSLNQCRESFSEMMRIASIDWWPPFYAFVTWFVTRIFGVKAVVLELFSIVPAILTMIIGAKFLWQKHKNTLLCVAFIIMVGVMPRALQFNTSIRGYSWGMFFITWCGISAYNYYQENCKVSKSIPLLIAGLLAAYTHYFALVSVAIIYLILFVFLIVKSRKNILKCVILFLINIACYAPWMIFFLRASKAVSSGTWIEPVTFRDLCRFIVYPFSHSVILAIIFCILLAGEVIFLVVEIVHKKDVEQNLILLMSLVVWLGTIFVGLVASILFKPMFVDRYVYFTMGLVWMFVIIVFAKMCESLLPKKCFWILIALIIVTGIVGGIDKYKDQSTSGVEPTKEIINKHYYDGIGIFSNISHLNWEVIEYYYPNSTRADYATFEGVTKNGTRKDFIYMNDIENEDNSLLQQFKDAGYQLKEYGPSNIDNMYYYNLYYVYK